LGTRVTPSLGLALLVALSSCCAYSFHGNLPAHLETVRVIPFRSSVTEYGLEQELTSLVTESFVTDGTLAVVVDSADSRIECTVSSWSRTPYSYSSSEEIEEYRLEIRVTVAFTDLVRDEPVFEQETVSRWIVYDPRVEDFSSAKSRLLVEAADEIVRVCLSGW
jgi:hypothetical protein